MQKQGHTRKLLLAIVVIALGSYPLFTIYYAGLTAAGKDGALLLQQQQLRSRTNTTPQQNEQRANRQEEQTTQRKQQQQQQTKAPQVEEQKQQITADAVTPKVVPPENAAADVTHRVAGLSCEAYGGPSQTAANEMIYWRDIPTDAEFSSPLKPDSSSKDELYLTFEPDEGGWNNIRMAMETAVALSVAMGRTLVLPPKMQFYRLWDGGEANNNELAFTDFFHFDSVVAEHAAGLKVISFQEFLEKEAMTGKMIDPATGTPSFPPGNRTDWAGAVVNYEATKKGQGKQLWEWMRSVTQPVNWAYDDCVVGIPSEPGKVAADRMHTYLQQVLEQEQKMRRHWKQKVDSYVGHPTPVNASAVDRLAELLANRKQLCVYDEKLQNTKVLHAMGETSSGFRLLIHFYAYLFFEDWKQDLWIKRLIRDHFRYLDEIQCGAARIVEQVRAKAREHGSKEGLYDAFHIRRGDFQYMDMHLSAEEIYTNNTRLVVQDGRTVFVATDERNKTFFDPLRGHYNILFLDDFKDQIQGINPNYYGMLDQLVASRADVFVGAFYSTFTGYINRMRGYHAQKDKTAGYKDGLIESHYYVPKSLAQFRHVMRTYGSVQQAFWQQEFPVCWRDIDHDVEEVDQGR
jgi:GDP-fucose protein O-fucosyltransferase